MVSFKDRIKKAGNDALEKAKEKAKKREADSTRPGMSAKEMLEGLRDEGLPVGTLGKTDETKQMKPYEVEAILGADEAPTMHGQAHGERAETSDDSGLQKLEQLARGGKKQATEEPPTMARPAVTQEEPPTVHRPKVTEAEEPPTIMKPAVTGEEPPTMAKPAVTQEEPPTMMEKPIALTQKKTEKTGAEPVVSGDSGLERLMRLSKGKTTQPAEEKKAPETEAEPLAVAPPSGVHVAEAPEKAVERTKGQISFFSPKKSLLSGGLKRYTFEIGWLVTTAAVSAYGALAGWVKQELGSLHGVVVAAVAVINVVLAAFSIYGKSKAIEEAKASEQRDKTARGVE